MLTFFNKEGEYFNVKFESPAISLSKKVWGYTDYGYIVDLFSSIAKEWKGWEGVKEWNSVEGEFGISATIDSLGHIMLSLLFREIEGSEEWSAECQLSIDSNQLDIIEKNMSNFFND